MKTTIAIDNIIVPIETKEITDCNILEVRAGTTGYRGGDSGHGGRTIVEFKDLASTDMRLSFQTQPLPDGSMETISGQRVKARNIECEYIRLTFGGDAEMDTFIEALDFAVKTLRRMREKKD